MQKMKAGTSVWMLTRLLMCMVGVIFWFETLPIQVRAASVHNNTTNIQPQSGTSLEDLADGLIEALSYAVPGSEFLKVLANADTIALSVLKGHLRRRQEAVTLDMIEGREERGTGTQKIAIINDLLAKTQGTKAAIKGKHKKEGEDPWSANFKVITPDFSIPTIVGQSIVGTAEIDTSFFRTASWVVPEVWNTDSPRQEPEGSIIFTATLLSSGDLQIDLSDFSFSLPTFPVNVPGYTETGINESSYSSGSFNAQKNNDDTFSFDFTTFGILTNDLYDATNPALDFVKVEGLIFVGDGEEPVNIIVQAQDTLLVPNPKPIDELPIIYAAAQTIFDPSTHSINFTNPLTGSSSIPLVAIDTFTGEFQSLYNGSEILLNSYLEINDLTIIENDGVRVYFNDTNFEITKDNTTLTTGIFTDVTLDLTTGSFEAKTFNVEHLVGNSILLEFFDAPHIYQFMSPLNALYFYQLTEGFSETLSEKVIHPHITLVNHNVVVTPEPNFAFAFFTIGILGTVSSLKGKKKTSQNSQSVYHRW